MSERVNLNDMMDNPRRSPNTTVFDITAGAGISSTTQHDINTVPKRQAVPVQTGYVDMNNLKPININEILPKREPKPNELEQSLYADLDAAIDREMASISERHDALFEAQQKEIDEAEAREEEKILAAQDDFALNGNIRNETSNDTYGLYDESDDDETPIIRNRMSANEMFGDDAENTMATDNRHSITVNDKNTTSYTTTNTTTTVKYEDENEFATPTSDSGNSLTVNTDNNTIKKDIASMENIETKHVLSESPVNILDSISNEDLFADDEEETNPVVNDTPSAQEVLDDLKGQIKERVAPIRKNLDLSKFTFAKKSVSAQKVMKLAVHAHQNVADWVLPSAQRAISMTGLSGPEILKLNPENSNRNRSNTFRDMYRIIYDHVFDGNKPEFETWLKQLRFVDLQHVYFALYMATFGGSNFVNYSCPKCKKVFIKDIDFKDMVIYANDETKENIKNILKMDTTSASKDEYEVELVQVSNNYAFGIRTPSVWNVIMETASLSDQFLEKHADLIDIVSYIDCAYLIDEANAQLIPVDTKPDPNDMAKTAARRIKAMYDIISTLSSEEYYALRAAIGEIDNEAGKVSYQIPECTCPACNTKIPANTEVTPDNMLFTRHQLAAIGNM